MGEMILCRENLAAMPFYMENTSVNIYSLEELIYLMEHQTYLIGPDIQTEEFCVWVGQELKLPELEEKLKLALQRGCRVAEFADTILSFSSYCDRTTGEKIKRQFLEYENKSEFECEIKKADGFLENEKYLSCIREYQNLLQKEDAQKESRELIGKIWHNMGTAYARLFFFEAAQDCFCQAFSYNDNPLSKQSMELAAKCLRDASGTPPEDETFLAEEEELQNAK